MLATRDHQLGVLATYKRIITIAGCANIIPGFHFRFHFKCLSFLSCSPSIIYGVTLIVICIHRIHKNGGDLIFFYIHLN